MVLQFFKVLAQSLDWLFTLMPLVMVVGVSMIKDAYEDNKRRKKDREENQALMSVCTRGGTAFQEELSEKIQVGSLVKVYENQSFPCDLILIKSSLAQSVGYVETKNLDGETNLKQKSVSEMAQIYMEDKESFGVSMIEAITGASVDCEGPNEFLYRFQGNLILEGG